jgi:hypothetical protein
MAEGTGGAFGLGPGSSGQVAGAARGHGGRHESGGVSCWLGWLGAGSGSCLLGAVLHTRFEVNTQPAATGARERGSEGARGAREEERMKKSSSLAEHRTAQ